MKTKQIASLVDEATELDRQIAELTGSLGEKKTILIGLATEILRRELGPPGDLTGSSYTFAGSPGRNAFARVQFPNPKLIGGFYFIDDAEGRPIAWRTKDDKAIQVGNVREVAGLAFEKLFAQSWKPAKSFRELALSHLGHGRAGKLVSMCEEPSAPRVGFETKDSTESARVG